MADDSSSSLLVQPQAVPYTAIPLVATPEREETGLRVLCQAKCPTSVPAEAQEVWLQRR